jgi:hypothetical protein
MKIFIFGNCQGQAIGRMLSHVGFDDITHIHNYIYIHNITLCDSIKTLLNNCDVFIYQPLSNKYPIYNTDNLKSYLKSSCLTISFSYIYNDGMLPLIKTFGRDLPVSNEYANDNLINVIYGNVEIISNLKNKGIPLYEILELYNNNKIDFNFKRRFENSLSILKEKEKNTDINISDFIELYHSKYKLFNYHLNGLTQCNHPSNILLIEICKKVIDRINLHFITYYNSELLCDFKTLNELIPGDHYPSRYEINFFKYEWITKEAETTDEYYKNIIIEIYNSC